MILFAILLAIAAAPIVGAQEIVAVLGSDRGPYQEAYQGFQAAFGGKVSLWPLDDTENLPKETRVVVAFGGKAASGNFPDGAALIYGMAPGIWIGKESRNGFSVKVRMQPDAAVMLKEFLAIQPKLRKLAVLWMSDSEAASVRQFEKAGAGLSIGIASAHLRGAGELPARLRALKGGTDAILLLADPAIVNAENFEIIKQFSLSSNIAFYVPTAGLVEQGATAAVSISYKEIGRAAAEAARSFLSGSLKEGDISSIRTETTINLSAAKEIGLEVPAAAVNSAARVIR
jgi:hypothetical protein